MGFLDLFNEGLLLKLRLFIYGVLVILSFFIFVGVGVTMGKCNGLCPLYGELKMRFLYNGPAANCDYTIAVAVIFQLVFLSFRLVSLILMMIGKLSTEMFLFSDVAEFLYVSIDLISFFLTFVAACILSAGAQEFLDSPYVFDFEDAIKCAQGGAWTSTVIWLIIGLIGLRVAWVTGKVPFVKARADESSQPKNGEKQTEMIDPASERFRV